MHVSFPVTTRVRSYKSMLQFSLGIGASAPKNPSLDRAGATYNEALCN